MGRIVTAADIRQVLTFVVAVLLLAFVIVTLGYSVGLAYRAFLVGAGLN